MKPELDIEMPLSAASTPSDGKTDAIMGELETPNESPFLWQNCENEDQRDRVDIKQQAVFDGLRLGHTIADKLRKRHEKQPAEFPQLLAKWLKAFGQWHQSYPSTYIH